MEECVFYHRLSKTLIVTDLVENFSGQDFNYWQRFVAKGGAGILAPNGKMPLDWRLSFMFSKQEARKHLNKLLSWNLIYWLWLTVKSSLIMQTSSYSALLSG